MAGNTSSADMLYSFKAFKKTPNEITAKIQDILEDTLMEELRHFVNNVEALNCYKKEVRPGDVERASTEDIAHFDACIDRIEAKLYKIMAPPAHVVLPGDEFLRHIEDDARLKRIETRHLIAMKAESNRKLREEIALFKKRQEVADRLKIAKQQVML
ncbi:hypothetical protein BIW11_09362 [Tropilaelaps mercedesae]|uniref:Protein MIS12 homolog n=1 Tax=Tropilaelaps mercedesae TaxID=418985 RepID=A0A1V9XKI5_9ACAR|nr:hypothetical protein BIW11_09362 [Tropilaelaps mercedesae]